MSSIESDNRVRLVIFEAGQQVDGVNEFLEHIKKLYKGSGVKQLIQTTIYNLEFIENRLQYQCY